MIEAIILAGGFGTRISEISNGLPKPLLEVAGKPILEHQIQLLQANGVHKIRLSLHHKADQIIAFCEKRWPGKIKFFVEPRPLGTGGAVKFASQGLAEPFLVVNGDVVCDISVSDFIASRANSIACVYKDQTQDFGLIRTEGNRIVEFLEKPKNSVAGFINAGWYLLEPEYLHLQPQDHFMIEKEIFPVLAARGQLRAYHHSGYWMDIGTPERYRQILQDLETDSIKKWFLA